MSEQVKYVRGGGQVAGGPMQRALLLGGRWDPAELWRQMAALRDEVRRPSSKLRWPSRVRSAHGGLGVGSGDQSVARRRAAAIAVMAHWWDEAKSFSQSVCIFTIDAVYGPDPKRHI